MTSTFDGIATNGEDCVDMPPLELNLIVAATRSMGIGRAGTLPWTGLRQEMAYFARVTKRLPTEDSTSGSITAERKTRSHNKVIMGRKTWESIPPKFRPLKDRDNIVLSRNPPPDASSDNAKWYSSLQAAVQDLSKDRDAAAHTRAFVIGGAEIYKAALELPQTKRILLTRVLSDFECDTIFPVSLAPESEGVCSAEWLKKSKEELDSWTGESVPEGIREESSTKYIFEMYERV